MLVGFSLHYGGLCCFRGGQKGCLREIRQIKLLPGDRDRDRDRDADVDADADALGQRCCLKAHSRVTNPHRQLAPQELGPKVLVSQPRRVQDPCATSVKTTSAP